MSDPILTALAPGFVLPAESSIVGAPCAPSGADQAERAADGSTACAPADLPDGPGVTRPGCGLPNPAEMRKDAQRAKRAVRPLCSRCGRAPVSDARAVLCEACGDHLIDLALDGERDGEGWWGG